MNIRRLVEERLARLQWNGSFVPWAIAMLVVSVLASVAAQTFLSYRSAMDRAADESRSMTLVLESRVAASLQYALTALDGVAQAIPPERIRATRPEELRVLLNAHITPFQSVGNEIELPLIGLHDKEGRLVASSVPPNGTLKAQPIAGMDFFEQLKYNRNLPFALSKVYVSTKNIPFVLLGRAMRDAAGNFEGCYVVPVRLSTLTALFKSVSVGAHGVILIRRTDNDNLVLRTPEMASTINQPAGSNVIFAAIQSGQTEGTLRRKSSVDGELRTYSYRVLGKLPLYVAVGINDRDVLAGWKMTTLLVGSITAGLVILLSLALLWLKRLGIREAAAVAAMQRSEMFYRKIFDESPLPMWLVDPADFAIRDVNAAACKYHCLSREALTSMTVLDFEARSRDAVSQLVHPHHLSSQYHFYAQHRLLNGELRDLEVFAANIFIDGKQYGLCYLVDVGARHAAERALIQARNQAERISQAKTAFMANIGHEMRTPLNDVLGMTQLLQTTSLEKDQRDFVLAAEHSAKTILNVLNEIVDMDRLESSTQTADNDAFELFELLQEVFGPFKESLVGRGLSWSLQVDNDVPHFVIGDRLRLWQVLGNVTSNALKYTESGGVVVRVERDADDPAVVCFIVRDSGIGIAPQVLERIFSFRQEEGGVLGRKFVGSSLGLSICKSAVELMAGSIDIESAVGQGTTVRICLPLREVDGSEIGNGGEGAAPGGVLPAMAQILVVASQPGLQAMVKHCGVEPVVVRNGAEVLEYLASRQVDVVVVDNECMGGDVSRFVEQIKAGAARSHLAIIVLADLDTHSELLYLAAGVSCVLAKSCTTAELRDALAEWLRPLRPIKSGIGLPNVQGRNVFDEVSLMRMFGNDRDMALMVIEATKTDLLAEWHQLETHIAGQEWDVIRTDIQTLKALASQVGGVWLAARLGHLEADVNAGVTPTNVLLAELARDCHELLNALDGFQTKG